VRKCSRSASEKPEPTSNGEPLGARQTIVPTVEDRRPRP